MSYDRYYKKTNDREAALKLLKRSDTVVLVCFILLFPFFVILLHFIAWLIFHTPVTMAVISIVIVTAASYAIFISDYVKKRKNGYRYVHCTHDPRPTVKKFEERTGEKGKAFDNSYGGSWGEGKVFRYTLYNDARINCDFDGGIYKFTVYNDEWDEEAVYTADREEKFDGTFKAALWFAGSLEKQPEGEYDESLEAEVEDDGYDEEENVFDGEEYEDEEKDEEENG